MKNIPISFDEADQFLEKMLYYYDICGLAAGIGDSRGLLHAKSAGIKNISTGAHVDVSDIFHMASVTKLFVSTAILQLHEQGLIALDEKLTAYLPWFSLADERYRQITIQDLLTHTSGLSDCKDYEWDKPRTDEDALDDYLKSIYSQPMLWPPGESRFYYSNIGFEALGAVIASVSGMSFEDYVTKNIFEPLSMQSSTLLTFNRDMTAICAPHFKNQEKHFEIYKYYPYNRAHGPSSTLTSNIHDIAKFAAAHLDTKLHSLPIYDRIWKEYALVPNNGEHIGLGWFIRKQNGYTLYGHEGIDDGFRSSLWICPETDLFIFVCANSDKSPVKKLNKQIFDMLVNPKE